MAVNTPGFHDAIGCLGQVGNVRDFTACEYIKYLRGQQGKKVRPEECCRVTVQGLEATEKSRGLHVSEACD